MSYESWRITYQSSEAAARAAWEEMTRLLAENAEMREQMAAIGAGGVEPLRKPAALAGVSAPAAPQAVLGWVHELKNGKIGGHFYTYEPHCDCAVRDDGGKKIAVVAAHDLTPLYTAPQAQAINLLAADHSGMKVDYRGLFSQVQRAIKRSDPGYAEMLRQLEGHITELGLRWYEGDTDAVDELLQLYCVERKARAALAAQVKQEVQL